MIQIDQIVRSKRKTIALIIQHDGTLVVRAPLRATDKRIRELVEQKADWVRAKQTYIRTHAPRSTPKTYAPGETFLYLGQPYPLTLVAAAPKPLTLALGQFCLKKSSVPQAPLIFTRWYVQQARAVFTERVELYAAHHGFSYKLIRISSARTRWGSCSTRGTLSFTWRLIMAPLPIIDYVVVHELAHTLHHNHGKDFWNLVRSIVPDFKEKVAWLSKNGELLNL